MAVTFRRPCRCGHPKDAHEHYRSGTDCGGCSCARFHGQLEITVRLGRPVPAVVLPEVVPAPREPYVRPTHGGLDATRSTAPEDRLRTPRAG